MEMAHHQHVYYNAVGVTDDLGSMKSFCNPMGGNGMAMNMDGFHFTLNQNHDAPCLNLFFPKWTLDTKGKFVTAMIGVTCLGIVTEAISAFRSRKFQSISPEQIRRQMHVMTLLHGLQALLGYILMLAAMTYSLELLFCTVFGLMIGYYLSFNSKMLSSKRVLSNTPCCDFMDDAPYGLESQSNAKTNFDYSPLSVGEEGQNQGPQISLRGFVDQDRQQTSGMEEESKNAASCCGSKME